MQIKRSLFENQARRVKGFRNQSQVLYGIKLDNDLDKGGGARDQMGHEDDRNANRRCDKSKKLSEESTQSRKSCDKTSKFHFNKAKLPSPSPLIEQCPRMSGSRLRHNPFMQ
jgi:hypothetical protein